MVANKALLSGTLLVTFISGGVTGYVAQGDGAAGTPQRYTVEYVFAREFSEMRDKGYSDTELREAHEIYDKYLKEYERWWTEFQEAYQANLDPIEQRFEESKKALEDRVDRRLDGSQEK